MGKGAFLEYIGKEAQTNRHKQTTKFGMDMGRGAF
jgi:hypothetical protein